MLGRLLSSIRDAIAPTPKVASSTTALWRKQTLNATVIRACSSCGAPGHFHDVSGVNVGCYDPSRINEPVGDVCPCCNAPRPAVEDKGQIWSKEFH